MDSPRKLKLEELNRLDVESYKAVAKIPLVLVLDNIRSALNVGAMFRTSDAFAIEKIHLCGITPQPPHKEINKTAIGADRSVEWSYEKDVTEIVKRLKTSGYTILGIEQTNQSIKLSDLEVSGKLVVIMGNEVEGISTEVLPLLDQAVELAQYGTKHSLNVSVCAGVVLWKLSQMIR